MKNNTFSDFAFFERYFDRVKIVGPVNEKQVFEDLKHYDFEAVSLWAKWRGIGQGTEPSHSNMSGLSAHLFQNPKGNEQQSFSRQFDKLAPAVASNWEYFASSIAYVAYILIVFFVVFGIYTIKVYPNLEQLISEFYGVDAVSVRPAGNALVLAVFLSGGLLALLLYLVQKSVRQLDFLPFYLHKFPLFYAFSDAYHAYLMVVWSALAGGGFSENVESLGAKYKLSESNLKKNMGAGLSKLRLAEHHGFFHEELEAQTEVLSELVKTRLLRLRLKLILMFQLLIFIAIGVVVSAMYKPIFQIGGVA